MRLFPEPARVGRVAREVCDVLGSKGYSVFVQRWSASSNPSVLFTSPATSREAFRLAGRSLPLLRAHKCRKFRQRRTFLEKEGFRGTRAGRSDRCRLPRIRLSKLILDSYLSQKVRD